MESSERYKLASNRELASRTDLRAFVWSVLTEMGLNPDIVNFKEDGITIESLNKLCKALYTVGYEDGRKRQTDLMGERKRLERLGTIEQSHRRAARKTKDKNTINKIPSL